MNPIKNLSRTITLVENYAIRAEDLLRNLPQSKAPIIGITGPPGAGKSTITDGLISLLVEEGKAVGVLCVDPSSPFNFGALLGDRIRMSQWYTNPKVFIRSLASRGSLGGLHPQIMEITDVMKTSGFDYIIVETVGVGQSEVEIAGLADVTIVVMVPEAGDEVQTMKAGLLEIADILVVNKADRPGADALVKNLQMMVHDAEREKNIEVVKTTATQQHGLADVFLAIKKNLHSERINQKKYFLLAEKAFRLIVKKRMQDISKEVLLTEIKRRAADPQFNLYRFVDELL